MEPINFDIDNLWVINIGGTDIWITRTIFNVWLIMAFLIIVAIVIRIALRKREEIPTGLQNAVELVVEFFDGMLKQAVGESRMYLGNWFFTVFIFILVSNLSGLVGLRPPTADWAMTFALALATFILIQIMGIKEYKWGYLKGFFEPSPLFLPLNILGELARPISLSFRLFGNVLSGMILVSLVYEVAPIFVRFAIPSVLHAYFDLFAGAIQTYIFCSLSMMFVGLAAGYSE